MVQPSSVVSRLLVYLRQQDVLVEPIDGTETRIETEQKFGGNDGDQDECKEFQ